MSYLDVLLRRVNQILSGGTPVTFSPDLNFTGGLAATYNHTSGQIDVSGAGGGGVAFDLVQTGNNADVVVTSNTQNVTVVMYSMSANRNVTLPAGVDGQRVTIKARRDGSLGSNNIVIASTGGATIDDAASPFTMTPGTFGDGGSVDLRFSNTLSEWERV